MGQSLGLSVYITKWLRPGNCVHCFGRI